MKGLPKIKAQPKGVITDTINFRVNVIGGETGAGDWLPQHTKAAGKS